MVLHILNKTARYQTMLSELAACIEACDSILLIEDAVYLCKQGFALLNKAAQVYVLSDDAVARGVKVSPPYKAVDYSEFVNLSLTHDKTLSW